MARRKRKKTRKDKIAASRSIGTALVKKVVALVGGDGAERGLVKTSGDSLATTEDVQWIKIEPIHPKSEPEIDDVDFEDIYDIPEYPEEFVNRSWLQQLGLSMLLAIIPTFIISLVNDWRLLPSMDYTISHAPVPIGSDWVMILIIYLASTGIIFALLRLFFRRRRVHVEPEEQANPEPQPGVTVEAGVSVQTGNRSRRWLGETAAVVIWRGILLISAVAMLVSFVFASSWPELHLAYPFFAVIIYASYRLQNYLRGIPIIRCRATEVARKKQLDAQTLINDQLNKFRNRKRFKLIGWDGFFVLCVAVWVMFALATVRDLISKGGM